MKLDLRSKLGSIQVFASALVLSAASPALAATGGASMPWDTGINALQSNFTGPVAKAAVFVAMAYTGYKWMFSHQHSEGGQQMVKVLFGGSCCLLAAQMLSSLGLDGALV